MQSALVPVFEGNLQAIKMYEIVDFKVVDKFGTFEKDVYDGGSKRLS